MPYRLILHGVTLVSSFNLQFNFLPCRLNENRSCMFSSSESVNRLSKFSYARWFWGRRHRREVCATSSYRNNHLALLFIHVDIHHGYDIKRNWRRERMSPDVIAAGRWLRRRATIFGDCSYREFPCGCYYNHSPQKRTATSFSSVLQVAYLFCREATSIHPDGSGVQGFRKC